MPATSKVKVIHIITRLELGGAQHNTLYTVSHMDSARFEVILASGGGGITGAVMEPQARNLAANSNHPFRLRFFPDLVRPISPIRDLIAFFQLWYFLYQEKPRIVHTHSSKAGILGRYAAWFARVPVVIHTYHGFGFHERQSSLVRWFYVIQEWLCCRFSTELIFVSEDNRRYAERYGLIPAGKGVLIRSGIRLTEYPAAIKDKAQKKASLGCRMHKPMIVSIGNFKRQKNPEGFLRVAGMCLKEIPELSFVFIGDGELRPKLEYQIMHHGMHNKVFLLGWRQDAPEILAASDAFILTSLWEGLPRALVEAMKSGLPCVAYASDGVRDLIRDGENGYLIPVDDEKLMASRILELLRDPAKAAAVGREAAASIGPEFDIDRMVSQQEDLYTRLIDRR